MNIKKLNESLSNFLYEAGTDYGVEVRNMHDALHYIFVCSTEEDANIVLNICKDLNDDQGINEDEAFNIINHYAKETLEIDYRQVKDGWYNDIYVINYAEAKPNIYF